MSLRVTQAIVVRLVDYGEADRVATLLCREGGKVAALGRGARSSRRRFGGLMLFARGEARLRERRGELWSLEGFELLGGIGAIAADMSRVAHAAYVCELARELVPLGAHDEGVFDLVADALATIERTGMGAPELRGFELSLLEAVGFAPALVSCVGCGRAAMETEALVLDALRGGVVCDGCGDGRGPLLSPLVRRAMERAQADGTAVALDGVEMASAREALQALLAVHLPRPLRSLEFIGKLNQATGGS